MIISITDILPYLSGENYPSLSARDLQLIKSLIKEVSGIIENYINSPLEEKTIVEYQSGYGTYEVYTNHIIKSISEIRVDPALVFSDDTILESSSYIVDYNINTIIRIDGLKFPNKDRSIKITYLSGWTKDDLPIDIKFVLCDVTAKLFDSLRKKSTDLSTQAGLGTSITYKKERVLLEHHKMILDSYKIPAI